MTQPLLKDRKELREKTLAPAYLRIIRPLNCVMMAFAVMIGAVMSVGPQAVLNSTFLVLAGALTGFLLTASSMVLNDYADREIDLINEPSRPIPSGRISPQKALAYGGLLMIMGVLAAWYMGVVSTLVAGVAWLLFLIYTIIGKRTGFLGNVLVSLCVAVPFLFGAVILATSLQLRVVIFACIAFLANLGREVNKGIVDVKGDQENGIKTIAVRLGVGKAALVAAILYLSAVLISGLPLVWSLVSPLLYIPFAAVTDVGFGLTVLSLLRDPSRENARTQKGHVMIWMLFGLIAFLAGSIS